VSTIAEPLERATAAYEARKPNKPKKRWTRFILPTYVGLLIFYLTFPIFVMILYSFNDTDVGFGTAPRVKLDWQGFTFDWYKQLFDIPDLTTALKHSLTIAVLAAVVATILGTFLGIALGRYRYRGKTGTDFVLFLNISAPEIALGAALAGFFVSLGMTRGGLTTFLAHVMFDIPFVAVTVRARVQGLDRSLEDAAMDLFATPATTFRKVTLPLILPGILAGGALAFALSIDDFIITNFVHGSYNMFPTWVYGAARVGIPPQAFGMATIIFVVGATVALVNVLVGRKKDKAVAEDDLADDESVGAANVMARATS
jgi:spermidine/putrescine transport system permease protein